MVSPTTALTSRASGVRAVARLAPVDPGVEAGESPAASAVAGQAPRAGPGAREALAPGYRNLALPLADAALAADGPAGESPLMAAYGPSEAMLASLPRLVGRRLPARAVARETQAAAQAQAETRGETAAELLDGASVVARSKLPSRNGADAEITLRTSLLVRDGERETAELDIYLAKTGPQTFEAVTYDRDFAAASGGFPYSAPPLSVDSIVFDPAYAAIVSVVAGGPSRGPTGPEAPRRLSLGALALTALGATGTLLVAALTLVAGRPGAATLVAAVGFAGLVLALGARAFR